jgi:hypothetical protein
MYLSYRSLFVRNVLVAVANGSITLVILLIAPMGLAGVITNTLMITIASFVSATFADRVIYFLQGSQQVAFLETDQVKAIEVLEQATALVKRLNQQSQIQKRH